MSMPDSGRGLRARGVVEVIGAGVALALAASALVWFFDRIPIEATSLGWDWRGLWQGISGGKIVYGNATGLRIAPWSLVLILPLGWLSFRASWAMITLISIAAVVLSIPPTRNRLAFLGMGLLLGTSFTSLRHIADGNFEGLVILGALLALVSLRARKPWGLAAGLLLATTKVQDAWLFAPVVLLSALQKWSRRERYLCLALLGAVVVVSLVLLGRPWLAAVFAIQERGSEVDMSLWATLTRVGIPWWGSAVVGLALLSGTIALARPVGEFTSREEAGLLMAASLLLSPYSSGNSLLAPLAVGAMTLVASVPWLGISLFVMDNLKYFVPEAWMFRWGPSYATAQTAFVWAGLAWWLIRRKRRSVSSVDEKEEIL